MNEAHFKIRIKNFDFEVEIESSDRKFVEDKLKDYAVINLEKNISAPQMITHTGFENISLAKLLKDNNATTNQNRKFLGAAVFLSVKGRTPIRIADITAALKDAGQTRLGNPSNTLNMNIKKGFIERTSPGEFMVTVHGKEEFGIGV